MQEQPISGRVDTAGVPSARRITFGLSKSLVTQARSPFRSLTRRRPRLGTARYGPSGRNVTLGPDASEEEALAHWTV